MLEGVGRRDTTVPQCRRETGQVGDKSSCRICPLTGCTSEEENLSVLVGILNKSYNCVRFASVSSRRNVDRLLIRFWVNIANLFILSALWGEELEVEPVIV